MEIDYVYVCLGFPYGGLVCLVDIAGRLHCLDADTGQCQWVYETTAETWGGPLVADRRESPASRVQSPGPESCVAPPRIGPAEPAR